MNNEVDDYIGRLSQSKAEMEVIRKGSLTTLLVRIENVRGNNDLYSE